MTTSELAERHSVRQQSMAAKLAELDAHGYLERQPHPTDRRKILIAISQDGRDRLNDDRRRRVSWLAEAITDRLNSREQRVLANTLSLLDRLMKGRCSGTSSATDQPRPHTLPRRGKAARWGRLRIGQRDGTLLPWYRSSACRRACGSRGTR